MCGLNGILLNKNLNSEKLSGLLEKMNDKIIHRGPDEDGFFLENGNNYSLGMAMRRLSIIDLSTGEQPIYSEDGTICIVFNGEIYNYKALKKMLQEKNVVFTTTSDTEVILKLYETLGKDSFSMLDGMFAFSIFDKNIDKVFITRDFFGEKPLFYTKNNQGFFWASELKSIISVINEKPIISQEGLNLFFQLTYIPAPFTIYKNVHKLEANHYIEINCQDISFTIREIQQNFEQTIDPNISFKDAKKITFDLVYDSVASRSVSDVPIGTFLSGGVDSSIVSFALSNQSQSPIDTFSIGFEKKSFDESDKSRTVAKMLKSNHHEFIVSIDDLKNSIDNILINFDEPFADSSSLPTYLVAHKTRQRVKVALTGDGGDEVFGGYNKYYIGKLNGRYTSIVPQFYHHKIKKIIKPMLSTQEDKRGKRFKAKKLLNAINYEDEFYYNIISLGYQANELDKILKNKHFIPNVLKYYQNKSGCYNNTLTDFRQIDKLISLEGDMLVKVDRTSMLASLESRAPFLNKNIWNFTNQLPEKFLMNGWNKKYILKESFKSYFPKGFLEKSKKGFGVPVGDWLRGHLSKELKSFTESNFLEAQNIFNISEISAQVENHLIGREDNTFKIWTFYCFQKWYIEIYNKL